MITSNIDRTDEAVNTNAPFEFGCPLTVGYVVIPKNAFLSVRLYISEDHTPPARLSKLTPGDDRSYIDVTFSDAYSKLIGTWRVYRDTSSASDYVSSVIRDEYGVISGHVTVIRALPALLYAACSLGEVETDLTDFKLLPQCCVPIYKGVGKAFVLDDTPTTANVTLTTSNQVPCAVSGSSVELDILGVCPYDLTHTTSSNIQLQPNKIMTVTVTNNSKAGASTTQSQAANGKHLIIRSMVTSNLRVTGGGSITFCGVTDEQ